jgi:hypothetical protein
MTKIPDESLESSSLRSVGYEAATCTLEVAFRSGGAYRYRDVPIHVYQGLMQAGSKGRYFNQAIRTEFQFERVPS